MPGTFSVETNGMPLEYGHEPTGIDVINAGRHFMAAEETLGMGRQNPLGRNQLLAT